MTATKKYRLTRGKHWTGKGPERTCHRAGAVLELTDEQAEHLADRLEPVDAHAAADTALDVPVKRLAAFLEGKGAEEIVEWYNDDDRTSAEPIYRDALKKLGVEVQEEE